MVAGKEKTVLKKQNAVTLRVARRENGKKPRAQAASAATTATAHSAQRGTRSAWLETERVQDDVPVFDGTSAGEDHRPLEGRDTVEARDEDRNGSSGQPGRHEGGSPVAPGQTGEQGAVHIRLAHGEQAHRFVFAGPG